MPQDYEQYNDITDFKKSNGNTWKWNYWRDLLEESIEESKDYLEEADRVKSIFKGEAYTVSVGKTKTEEVKPVYNILYSNIETLKPLIFSRLPNPRIRKRNLEKNNINKLISIVLERNIKRVLEETDAQNIIEQARDDFLLTKRGVVKVLYEQEIITIEQETEVIAEDGSLIIKKETIEDLGEKIIDLEYIAYKNVIFSSAETWEKVEWVAFRHFMGKEELKNRFGTKKANLVNLGNEINPNTLDTDSKDQKTLLKKAEVWEIWDKDTLTVNYFCEGYDTGLLKEVKDEYNLHKFFNIARPLGVDSGVDKVNCPIPDYTYYEEQAKEIDRISNRIIAILPYISMGGVYSDLLTTDDASAFLKAIESYSPVSMPADTDINKLIKERDLSKLAGVLQTLYQERLQSISAVQEITGISDIVRGQSVASETATAQELKGNFAISRLQPLQQEMSFFCRDLIRIIAELLAEKFDILELAQAAGLKIFDMDELVEKFTKELEEAGVDQKEFTPALNAKLKPYKQDIKAGVATTINNLIEAKKILESDKLRGWAIEVETDSTISVDQDGEKRAAIELATAISNVTQQFLPVVQSGMMSKDAFKSILGYIVRRFEGGEELEGLLEEEEEESNPADQMQQQMAEKEMELEERKVATQEFTAKTDAQLESKKLDIEEGKAVMEADSFQDELSIRSQEINDRIANSKIV